MARKDRQAQSGAETETDETASEAPESEGGDESAAEIDESAQEPVGTAIAGPITSVSVNLHGRLEKAMRELHTAPQDVVFPLHTVEMLTGRLKTILPEAIKAASDEELKADLQTLLGLL
jgi:hypothetical protein